MTQLKLTEGDKPLVGVSIELYMGKPTRYNDLPYETLTTNFEGIASTSELSIAKYYLLVRAPHHRAAEFALNIPLEAKTQTSHGFLSVVATPLEIEEDRALGVLLPSANAGSEKALEIELQRFHGVVIDPSTAVIPNTEITVYKAVDSKQAFLRLATDAAGQFFADLPPGKYTVNFFMRGFVQQRIIVTVGAAGWHGLQLTLAIGECTRVGKSEIKEYP